MSRIANHVRGHFVAYLALFFALGGTSFAAVNALPRNSVGSAQIKNGAIQKVDISKRTVSSLRGLRGLRGTAGLQGPAGPAGPPGATGAQGAQGVPGTSVFSATVPSGQTVRGVWGIGAPVTGSIFDEVSLPVPAPQRLTAAIVNFKAGTPGAEDGDAACTGTVASPTAPPGKVCLYTTDFNNTTAVGGYQISSNDDAERYGFTVAIRNSGPAIDGRGTWAYTAP